MVRTYVRKTQKGAGILYTTEDLNQALEDIRAGRKTTRGASTFYNIPRSTLKHRIKGTRGSGLTSKEGRGGGGVESYLSSAEENEIVHCLKVMEKNGFGLSREEVLDLVQLYIKQNNIQSRFKDGRPGADWFIGFKTRHRLSIKKPQSVEYIRSDQINPWVIYDFFEVLEKTIKELNLEGKPGQIFNCDETSFCHDPSKTKVVGAIGTKSFRKTSSAGRENTSVLLSCSAEGDMIPLLFVFKGKYVMENWINDQEISQTAVSATSRGWMETTLFYNWFRDVFLPNITDARPILLIYDGHSTHISTGLIRLAQENKVTIMKLPPHTTHVLQPLDVSVFKSLKTNWDKTLCKWQRENPRKRIPKQMFVHLLTKLAQEVPRMNIINGFKSTGIYDEEKKGPSKDAIPLSYFKKEDLLRFKRNSTRPDIPEEDEQPETGTLPDSSGPEEARGLSAPSSASNIPKSPVGPTILAEAGPSSAKTVPEERQSSTTTVQKVGEPTNSTIQLIGNPTIQVEAGPSSDKTVQEETGRNEKGERKGFEELLLEMIGKGKQTETQPKKRRRLVTNCEIITTKDYLLKKEAEEKMKNDETKQKHTKNKNKCGFAKKNITKRLLKIKKKDDELMSDSSDDLDFKDIIAQNDKDIEEEKEFELICSGEKPVQNLLLQTVQKKVGEYVIFLYEEEYFPGKILSYNDEEVEISAMKKSLKSWKWPDKEDVGKYSWDDVVGSIDEPKKISKRGFYQVKELTHLWDK